MPDQASQWERWYCCCQHNQDIQPLLSGVVWLQHHRITGFLTPVVVALPPLVWQCLSSYSTINMITYWQPSWGKGKEYLKKCDRQYNDKYFQLFHFFCCSLLSDIKGLKLRLRLEIVLKKGLFLQWLEFHPSYTCCKIIDDIWDTKISC